MDELAERYSYAVRWQEGGLCWEAVCAELPGLNANTDAGPVQAVQMLQTLVRAELERRQSAGEPLPEPGPPPDLSADLRALFAVVEHRCKHHPERPATRILIPRTLPAELLYVCDECGAWHGERGDPSRMEELPHADALRRLQRLGGEQ